ncbi:glycosyltransferase [Candidatus Saccharibacteria bacterium]|nr:glycosyltransferase [Candidatus Saccharibacteria bacterium]
MKVTVAIPHAGSKAKLEKLLGQLAADGFDSVLVLGDKERKGPASARNLALGKVKDGVIWFLDDDMELVSEGNRAKIEKIFADGREKIVGTLILDKKGEPMRWNYGKFIQPLWLDGLSYWKLKRLWAKPERRRVDWVAEGSMVMEADLFRRLGGFDAGFLYHEGQDLCRRAGGAEFEPSVVVRHNQGRTRLRLMWWRAIVSDRRRFLGKRRDESEERSRG